MVHRPIFSDTYPENAWLLGYFKRGDTGGHGEIGANTPSWKNIDFMRLRDSALHLLAPRPGTTILDVGCSIGATMVYCGLQGARVFGVDMCHRKVTAARASLREFHVDGEAHCADAAYMPFAANRFDGAVSNDFFEHVTDEEKIRILAEVYRVLKPGAPLVIRTPNLRYLTVAMWIKRARAVARGRNPWSIMIPHTPGTPDPEHIGLTTRWGLARCLEHAGFVNYGFHYVPLRRFGLSAVVETLSTEIPVVRDWCSEGLLACAWKPIALAHFPD